MVNGRWSMDVGSNAWDTGANSAFPDDAGPSTIDYRLFPSPPLPAGSWPRLQPRLPHNGVEGRVAMQRLEPPVPIYRSHVRRLGIEAPSEPFKCPGGVFQGEVDARDVVLADIASPRGAEGRRELALRGCRIAGQRQRLGQVQRLSRCGWRPRLPRGDHLSGPAHLEQQLISA